MQLSKIRHFVESAGNANRQQRAIVTGILQNIDNLETTAAVPVGIFDHSIPGPMPRVP
jgi:hypothetical protein